MFFGGVTGSAVAEVSRSAHDDPRDGQGRLPLRHRDRPDRGDQDRTIPPSIGMIIYAHIAGSV
jgi:hypothetical protein